MAAVVAGEVGMHRVAACGKNDGRGKAGRGSAGRGIAAHGTVGRGNAALANRQVFLWPSQWKL